MRPPKARQARGQERGKAAEGLLVGVLGQLDGDAQGEQGERGNHMATTRRSSDNFFVFCLQSPTPNPPFGEGGDSKRCKKKLDRCLVERKLHEH